MLHLAGDGEGHDDENGSDVLMAVTSMMKRTRKNTMKVLISMMRMTWAMMRMWILIMMSMSMTMMMLMMATTIITMQS